MTKEISLIMSCLIRSPTAGKVKKEGRQRWVSGIDYKAFVPSILHQFWKRGVKRRSQDMRIPDAFNRDSEDLKKTK